MAKKAKMANINAMRGINIFKDGIPGNSEADTPHSPEQPATEASYESDQRSAVNHQASESSYTTQAEATSAQPSVAPSHSPKNEKKTLRSYHLSESLINKLEDAHMVYSLKKIDKSKQDIVAEALEKHFADLEAQGFFQVLELLRG